MVKRGTYNGGSTVIGPGSSWLGDSPDEPLSLEHQAEIRFRNLLRKAGEEQLPQRSPLDARASEKKKSKKVMKSIEVGEDKTGSFVVEVKQRRFGKNFSSGNKKRP